MTQIPISWLHLVVLHLRHHEYIINIREVRLLSRFMLHNAIPTLRIRLIPLLLFLLRPLYITLSIEYDLIVSFTIIITMCVILCRRHDRTINNIIECLVMLRISIV